MKVLFIGGTGTLSRPCTLAALKAGHDVYHLNRGSHSHTVPAEVITMTADARDSDTVCRAVQGLDFDCVVNFIAFVPEHVRQDLRIFSGSTGHYVLISSAAVYQKPPPRSPVTEGSPVGNPRWRYAARKLACEQQLEKGARRVGLPFTIVRPSYTYGDGWIPSSFGSRDYTTAARMLAGKKIIVHDDGRARWTLTHAEDFADGFAPLLGNRAAFGETVHITSEEALTWDEIHREVAAALGVAARLVHVPSVTIARYHPERGASLLGDKAHTMIFDNSGIRRLVPGFSCSVRFTEGIRRSVRWYEENPEARVVDSAMDRLMDRILSDAGEGPDR